MRILLVDDHALVRAGIRALLEHLPGVEVVGEAADGIAALALIKTSQPDVVLRGFTAGNARFPDTSVSTKDQIAPVPVRTRQHICIRSSR